MKIISLIKIIPLVLLLFLESCAGSSAFDWLNQVVGKNKGGLPLLRWQEILLVLVTVLFVISYFIKKKK